MGYRLLCWNQDKYWRNLPGSSNKPFDSIHAAKQAAMIVVELTGLRIGITDETPAILWDSARDLDQDSNHFSHTH